MSLRRALARLGTGPLREEALAQHIYPLFSKSLEMSGIYLANHSLGRPLDQTEEDLCKGFRLWQSKLGDAWEGWLEEQQAHRWRLVQLIGAPRSDCIIPKASAGQGLRTILNGLPGVPRVVSTTGEFDSIDVILKQYAALDRIALQQVPCENRGWRPRSHSPGRKDPALAGSAGPIASDVHVRPDRSATGPLGEALPRIRLAPGD
jgi:kynureninase